MSAFASSGAATESVTSSRDVLSGNEVEFSAQFSEFNNLFVSSVLADQQPDTMEGSGNAEQVPNSQEIIDMMLQMPEHATAPYSGPQDCRLSAVLVAPEDNSSAAVVNNNNLSNPNNNMSFYITTSQQIPLIDDENEQDLQNFADMLMAPTTPQMVSATQQQSHHQPQYHDVKVSHKL